MDAMVQAALATLSADPLVHDELRGRRFVSGSAYFPHPDQPRYVVVPLTLIPRADEPELLSLGLTGFHELQYRIDRLHLRIIEAPTPQRASTWLHNLDSSFAVALPLARAKFASLPQADDWRKSGIPHKIRAVLNCYSGRNDTWSITFVPTENADYEVTLEVDPHAKQVRVLH